MSVLIDSFDISNYLYLEKIHGASDTGDPYSDNSIRGECFTCTAPMLISSAKFVLRKKSTPTGYMRAKLYSLASGTFGTDAIPGELLATSEDINVSVLTDEAQLIEFSFSDSYLMESDTNYGIAFEYTGGTYTEEWGMFLWDNCVYFGYGSDSYHGNTFQIQAPPDNWYGGYYYVACFYVYGDLVPSRPLSVSPSISPSLSPSPSEGSSSPSVSISESRSISLSPSSTESLSPSPSPDYTYKTPIDIHEDSNIGWYGGVQSYKRIGESFPANGLAISGVFFYLDNTGYTDGNIYVNIYALSSNLPTGSPLATSDPLSVNQISDIPTWKNFNFSGANQITLTNGVYYYAVVMFDDITPIASKRIGVYGHALDHGACTYDGSNWSELIAKLIYKIYSTTGSSSPSSSYSLSSSLAPSSSLSPSSSNSRSISPSPSLSPSPSVGTASPSRSPSPSASVSPSASPSIGTGKDLVIIDSNENHTSPVETFIPFGPYAYHAGEPNLPKIGQSFIGNGSYIDSVLLRLKTIGSPTGNVVLKIYKHSGTYGTTGIPSNKLMAVSEVIPMDELDPGLVDVTFVFTGLNRMILIDGFHYFLVIEYLDSTYDNTIACESTVDLHDGNVAKYFIDFGNVWYPDNIDLFFIVYGYSVVSVSASPSRSPSLSQSPSSSTSPSYSVSLSPSASQSPSSSISQSPSLSPSPSSSESSSISASPSPSSSISPSGSPSPSSTEYVDKFSKRNTIYTEKLEDKGTIYSDKYSDTNTIYSDKHQSNKVDFADKFTHRDTNWENKY